MVVLRPGNNVFDKDLITFGELTKNGNGYCAELLYDNNPLYYQFNDCYVGHGMDNETYVVEKLSKDYESIEQAIQERLVEESPNMFKRGFAEEMLLNMQKGGSLVDRDYPCVSTYTKRGTKSSFAPGESDVIFQCCCVVFEQSSWQIVWSLVQIRQEQDDAIDSNYLFVDDTEEDDNEEQEQENNEDGYESDNEQENFMFVPKPINE